MSLSDIHLSRRVRWAMALAMPIVAIVLLVLAYRLTAPVGRPSTSTGEPLAESDVLRVGALPVT